MLTRCFSMFIPMAILYTAIGFWARDLFRSTSKLLFQFRLFKEDETKMPTTEMLLYKNKLMAKDTIDRLHRKVKEDFNLDMKSAEEELKDEREARLSIVEAVGAMRNVTRGNEILEQANYRYGFSRNLLGGLVWALVILLILLVAYLILCPLLWWVTLLGMLFVILQGIASYIGLKAKARNYAKTLADVYLTTKVGS